MALAVHKMLKDEIPHPHYISELNEILLQEFEAHAWLTVGNEIIIGGDNVGQFQEITK